MQNNDGTETHSSGLKVASFVGLGIVALLFGLAVLARTDAPDSRASSLKASNLAAAKVPAYDTRLQSPNKEFDLSVQDNKLVSGPATITVSKGDSVQIHIKALGSKEIDAKLSGYDITTESAPEDATPGGFSFIADKTGNFAYFLLDEGTSTDKSVEQHQIGTLIVK